MKSIPQALGARLAAFLVIAAAAPLAAQEEPKTRAESIIAARQKKAEELEPQEPNEVEQKLLIVQQRQLLERFGTGEGLFPKFGGLQTGQGFSAGVQYRQNGVGGTPLRLSTFAVFSIRKSQRYNLTLEAPTTRTRRFGYDVYADHRNLATVDYYGPGAESSLEDRTSFRLERFDVGGGVKAHPGPDWLRLGARAAYLRFNVGPGQRSSIPSTDAAYTPQQTPGLDHQTDFLRTSGLMEIDYRKPTPSGARSGGLYSLELAHYEDVNLKQYDFQRLDAEVQQYFGFYNDRRVIMLRGRTSISSHDGDHLVPFYLQPYLGGPRELRGFNNYRFYDNHALVMNVEYRWEAFSGLDMALFFDAGKVANRRADLDLSDLETDVGVGFRFNGRNSTFLRLDVAFSHEAAKVWFRFGSPF